MTNQAEKNESQSLQIFHIKQRRAMNNAYAALLAQQNTNSFAAFTFEEAVDQQIERIEGKGTQIRPNLLTRVDRIESQLLQAVEELRKVPPDRFLERDPNEDVNTDEE
jgi:hypothetical protein